MICINCARAVENTDKYCSNCGTKVEQLEVGAPIETETADLGADSEIFSDEETDIVQPSKIDQPQYSPKATSKTRSTSKWIFVSVGVVALLAFFGVIVGTGLPQNPAPTSTSASAAMPDLIGLHRSEAEPILEAIGITWDQVRVEGTSGTIIINQSPNPGETVVPGSTVISATFRTSSASGSSGGGQASNWPPTGYSALSNSVAYQPLDPSEMHCDYSGARCFQARFVTNQSCSLYVEVNFLVNGVSVDRSNDLRTVSMGQPAVLNFNSFTASNYSGEHKVRIVDSSCF